MEASPTLFNPLRDGLEPEVLHSMNAAIAEAYTRALETGSVRVSGVSQDGNYYLWKVDAAGNR
jgi:hypothetical protein